MKARQILLTLAQKYDNDWAKMYECIMGKKYIEKEAIEDIPNAITILDENYPKALKQIYKPPFVFYYKGDIKELEKDDYILMVGENRFKIAEENIITIENNVLNLGGKLKIWGDKNDDASFRIAFAFIKKVAFTKMAEMQIVSMALNAGKDIYITPTTKPSVNNKLIKEGAFLLDCKADLE